jgi:hypothetical protein
MVVKGINFRSLVFAGFAAGYLMYFVDHWFAGFLGLFGLFPGTSNPWWMLEHHIDSILFALPFAWPAVYNALPNGGWLKGLVYGLIWVIGLFIVMAVAGALGAEAFGQIPWTASFIITDIVEHLVWGFFLGVLYTPGKTDNRTVSPA